MAEFIMSVSLHNGKDARMCISVQTWAESDHTGGDIHSAGILTYGEGHTLYSQLL